MSSLPPYIALQELYRRLRIRQAGGIDARTTQRNPGADVLKSHLFEQQLRVLQDPSDKISVCCSRRSGKSMVVGTVIADVAVAYDGSEALAYCPTLAMAYRNIVKPIKEIAKRYSVNVKIDRQRNELHWPNGSVTYLLGADRADDIDKARGLAVHAALLDEVQRFKEGLLEELIDEVVIPALEDYSGKLYLTGTPKPVCTGYFYHASTETEGNWSKHTWTRADNIYFPRWAKMRKQPKYADFTARQLAEIRLDQLCKANGWTRDLPKVRREWLGQWARDENSFIYPYSDKLNHAEALPTDHDWRFGMGVDLGVNAISVLAWSPTCREAYVVEAEKVKHTTMDQLGSDIARLGAKWGVTRYQVDAAALGKYIVSELRKRTGLPLQAADKTDKASIQEIARTDLQMGRIKALPAAKPLVDEWRLLQYNDNGEEPRKSNNHCSDAFLYIYRWARNYFAKAPPVTEQLSDDEREERRILAHLMKKGKQNQPRDLASRLKRML